MANRINLNQTSFHGAGAIKEIAAEVKVRGLKKALIPNISGTTVISTPTMAVFPRTYFCM